MGERLCELPLLVIEAAQTAFQGGVVGGSNLFQQVQLLLGFEIGLQCLSGLLLSVIEVAQGNPGVKSLLRLILLQFYILFQVVECLFGGGYQGLVILSYPVDEADISLV